MILLDKAIDVADPEQMVFDNVVAVATGRGLTVIITSTGTPEQPAADEVTA